MNKFQYFRFYMNRESNPDLFDYLSSIPKGDRSSCIRDLLFLGYEKKSVSDHVANLMHNKKDVGDRLLSVQESLERIEKILSGSQVISPKLEEKKERGEYFLSGLSKENIGQLKESVKTLMGHMEKPKGE